MISTPHRAIIGCGMYSFTPGLQNAWRDLFRNLHRHLGLEASQAFHVCFDFPDSIEQSGRFSVLHTCGYPYISSLRQTHRLVCVPEFDMQGTRNLHYASWFVARADDERHSLEQFRNSIAVINTLDSNSGMNVLRHAISKIAEGGRFFNGVLVSGAHLRSLDLILRGAADIAAIDAVTWDLAARQGVAQTDGLKIIGVSEYTAGLPFVTGNDGIFPPHDLCQAFNACLGELSPQWKDLLRIRTFSPVETKQYEQIAHLEEEVRQAGYPQLY